MPVLQQQCSGALQGPSFHPEVHTAKVSFLFVSSTKLLFYLVFAKYPVQIFKKVYILQGRTVAICIPGKFMFATESFHEILIGIYGYIKCGCPVRLFETVSQDS